MVRSELVAYSDIEVLKAPPPAAIPVNALPSPANAVAVAVPVMVTPPLALANLTALP